MLRPIDALINIYNIGDGLHFIREDSAPHYVRPFCKTWESEVNAYVYEENIWKMQTFVMGSHDRLGEGSRVRLLSDDLFPTIWKMFDRRH